MKAAFTFVELLASLAIISLLLAIAVPAVQFSRETSRRNDCMNNARQLGLAAQLHQAAFQTLPSNGGFTDQCWIKDAQGVMTRIGTENFQLGFSFLWGIGRPGNSPRDQTGCWAYSLLPYLEQSSAYDDVAISASQPRFLCVSRPDRPTVSPAEDRYGRYQTGGLSWARTDYAANRFVVANRPRVMSLSDIRDGTSHTIFCGEKSIDPIVHATGSWIFDEPIFSGGSHGTARDGNKVVRDRAGFSVVLDWGSQHPSGAIFSMADGSVHNLGFEIDQGLMTALLTPNEGENQTLQDYFGH